MNPSPSSLRRRIGFWLGTAVAILIIAIPTPDGMTPDGQKVFGIAALMAVWWISEAIPLYATALVPLVAFPFLGIMKAGGLASAYGHHFIFLFMGGFFLAKAIERWNLHERLALNIIAVIGTTPRRIVLGLMAATAFLSMWISDTASTMVMFPIAMAVLHHIGESLKQSEGKITENFENFASCLLLAVAYASLIGGIATLIGTPPNIVFAGAIKTLYPDSPEITFFEWMKVGLPLTLVFLPLTWIYLTRVAIPVKLEAIPGGSEAIEEKRAGLGPMSRGEGLTLMVFFVAIFGWVFRKNIEIGSLTLPGWSNLLGLEDFVNDATVAIFVALLLFIIPADAGKGEFLLNWDWAKRIPWGILILFGGGIALASAVQDSGLSKWIGEGLTVLSAFPVLFMVLGVCLLMTFLTEITSNTAIATIFMPILGAIGVAMGVNPMLFMVPAAMSASCAFMLPVATPPNAIVFGSGYISVPQMARTGLGLNLIGAILITLTIYLLAIPVFGISLTGLPPWAR
jgi:solute carrier family 13 (sodium-dependent dicarboxylate transporter), member 2/3/5